MEFTEELRSETQVAHLKAESCNLMKSFLDLTIKDQPHKYDLYLACFLEIYKKLEEKLQDTNFYFPDLNRTEAIKKDLAYFGAHLTPNLDSLRNYLNHIEKSDDLQLIAHSYVRYLGDLSGGFIISKKIKLAFDLTDKGFDFYEFDKIAKPSEFKAMYKAKLNELNLNPEDRKKFISTANEIFELNYELFQEIY